MRVENIKSPSRPSLFESSIYYINDFLVTGKGVLPVTARHFLH